MSCNYHVVAGHTVYNLAKVKLIDFIYDFVQELIPRDRYQVCLQLDKCSCVLTDNQNVMKLDMCTLQLIMTDTDSLYMAIAAESFAEAVPEEKQELYERLRKVWLAPEDKMDLEYWRPGKCKLEFRGVKMIAECPKAYVCVSEDGSVVMKAKGANKAQNMEKLTVDRYERTLHTGVPIRVVNNMFLLMDGVMKRVSMVKDAVTNICLKGRIQADMHTIRPVITDFNQ